jgi:hypothetical protein
MKSQINDNHLINLHLIFEKSSNLNFAGQTGSKNQVEVDKKSSSSNLIFQTQFFKNQLKISRGNETPVYNSTLALLKNPN